MNRPALRAGTALGIVACVALVAACGSSKPATGASGSATPAGAPAKHCTASEDCELVQACCGCTAGGRQIAIRADAVAAFEASHPERCGTQICATVLSSDPSCMAEAICGGDGECQVAPHLQHE